MKNELASKWVQRFSDAQIELNRVLMEAAKEGVKPVILVHEDGKRFGKDVQMVEVSLFLPIEELPENAAIIRRFLREMECFDEKLFAENDGWGAFSQLANMVMQIKRLEEQVGRLEKRVVELQNMTGDAK